MKKRMLILSLGFILAGVILTRIGPYGTQNNLEDSNEKIEEQAEEQVVELVEVDEPTIPYVKDVNILDYYNSDGIVVVKTDDKKNKKTDIMYVKDLTEDIEPIYLYDNDEISETFVLETDRFIKSS